MAEQERIRKINTRLTSKGLPKGELGLYREQQMNGQVIHNKGWVDGKQLGALKTLESNITEINTELQKGERTLDSAHEVSKELRRWSITDVPKDILAVLSEDGKKLEEANAYNEHTVNAYEQEASDMSRG